jgi:hypothetical protein
MFVMVFDAVFDGLTVALTCGAFASTALTLNDAAWRRPAKLDCRTLGGPERVFLLSVRHSGVTAMDGGNAGNAGAVSSESRNPAVSKK